MYPKIKQPLPSTIDAYTYHCKYWNCGLFGIAVSHPATALSLSSHRHVLQAPQLLQVGQSWGRLGTLLREASHPAQAEMPAPALQGSRHAAQGVPLRHMKNTDHHWLTLPENLAA